MYAACAEVGRRARRARRAAAGLLASRSTTIAGGHHAGDAASSSSRARTTRPACRCPPRRSRRIARALPPGAVLFVDEAYADFAGATLHRRACSIVPELVVGRTFAKARAGGAARRRARRRAGHARSPLRRVVPPYSVNVCAVAALAAALADRAYLRLVRRPGAPSRATLHLRRSASGSACTTGRARRTSCWSASATRAPRWSTALAARGIYVRDRSRDAGCAGCIRITAGVVEHTEACVAALEEVLCAARVIDRQTTRDARSRPR